MSLDTVLKIGRALRESENWLEHYRYIASCPKKDGSYQPICLSIPVDTENDISFDWANISLQI